MEDLFVKHNKRIQDLKEELLIANDMKNKFIVGNNDKLIKILNGEEFGKIEFDYGGRLFFYPYDLIKVVDTRGKILVSHKGDKHSFETYAYYMDFKNDNNVVKSDTVGSCVFERELNLIENIELKRLIEDCLNKLPDYFYKIPASGSGKYHPQYALGEGGLVRHVKATIGIAEDLLRSEVILLDTQCNKDIVVSALILHDGLKNGFDNVGRMVSEHPLLVVDFIKEQYLKGDYKIQEYVFVNLLSGIASHMGKWNTDKDTGEEILPKPKSDIEKFIHICDYLASRKKLEYIFEE